MNRIDPTLDVLALDVLARDVSARDALALDALAVNVPAANLAGTQDLALEPSRALVVADDPLVRQSLSVRLGSVVVGEASCADDLGHALIRTHANVVLWDLGPEAATERELTGQVSALPVPVVALAPSNVARVGLLSAGVAAVVSRELASGPLASALLAARHGLRVMDAGTLDEFERPATAEIMRTQVDGLTHREHEVVQLMAEGLSNKQIADRLGISAHTAKFHVNSVLGKLRASTRTEAVVRAVQRGVVML